jgi:hypothetical protein
VQKEKRRAMVNESVMGVDRAGKPGSVPPAGGRASDPLRRFRAGEISVDAYIDLKVEEATAHLAGLSSEELDAVRAALRLRIAESGELQELVRQATRR